ncbi:hypothetical protein OUZ56_019210 [Daphnia magna]|uniref:Uncharacterized protein n=1 Tax=Daphnia magna TaxID=35525 RepID=A0ABQ9ZAZ5_9CRUS|nr:hypothetical protein OUZ56_019210 [Daphnia magna]
MRAGRLTLPVRGDIPPHLILPRQSHASYERANVYMLKKKKILNGSIFDMIDICQLVKQLVIR